MKDLLESSECFEAYATIDACYYVIGEMQTQMNKQRSGIEIAIDNATGYGKAENDEIRDSLIEVMETMIESKKVLEAPIEEDLKHLEALKNMG